MPQKTLLLWPIDEGQFSARKHRRVEAAQLLLHSPPISGLRSVDLIAAADRLRRLRHSDIVLTRRNAMAAQDYWADAPFIRHQSTLFAPTLDEMIKDDSQV